MTDARLDIFFGAADQAAARVYAQLSGPDLAGVSLAGVSLGGTVHGPACEYASTLRASVKLRDLGAGPTPLAEAVVPDPCFWTPDTPFVYSVQVEIRRDGQTIATEQRLIGIRRLSTHGKNLILDAKRWVLRGVDRAEVAPHDLADWREAGAAMVVADPTDELCGEASRWGVWLVAQVTKPRDQVADELRRLACWPAVALAVVSGNGNDDILQHRPRNMLLGQSFEQGQPVTPAAWAQAVLCEIDQPTELPVRIAGCTLPVLVVRRQSWPSLTAARAGCDSLQRDLAATGDFAGYIA